VTFRCSKGLVDRFTPGSLVIADRGFYGYDLWVRAAATGADLLWRVKKNLKPVFVEDLGDGSWLGEIRRGGRAGRKANPVRVRVIDYNVDNGTPDDAGDGDDNSDGGFRLITTVLDPADIDAGDLAAAYWQRWEIETVFDELKTHQRGARGVLRSKSPDLVHQELWAMLCCH
jgi:IS4 transposase